MGRGRVERVVALAEAARTTVRARLVAAGSDRGDVPGWVLVTLMTAGLVTALWLVAGPALSQVFSDAIEGVTGP